MASSARVVTGVCLKEGLGRQDSNESQQAHFETLALGWSGTKRSQEEEDHMWGPCCTATAQELFLIMALARFYATLGVLLEDVLNNDIII